MNGADEDKHVTISPPGDERLSIEHDMFGKQRSAAGAHGCATRNYGRVMQRRYVAINQDAKLHAQSVHGDTC
jgi:hypothetical protein